MKKLLLLSALLIFACNKDGSGLYGPVPDPFDWNYDLGIFNGDVDMYIDGTYDSTEYTTLNIASSWQNTDPAIGYPWELSPFAPNCSSSNFILFNELATGWTGFANSCGILDGEIFTIFNVGSYPIFDDSESPSIIFWAETYGEGTFDGNEIHIEFYEVFRNIDMDEIVSTSMWTGTLTKVD
jgi:hypothetical protein